MTYKVHPKYRDRLALVAHTKDGKAVNLMGKEIKKTQKNRGPEYETTIPAATEEDLRFVHESGAKDRYGDLIVIAVPSPGKDQVKEVKSK